MSGIGSRSAPIALALCVALAIVAPAGSTGATLAHVRGKLRAWHLQPAPLFPRRLPPAFAGASAALDRAGFDFDVEWSKNRRAGGGVENYFAVAFRRGDAALLATLLNDREIISKRRIRIGRRIVWSVETGHAGAPSFLAWSEQGRTYMLAEKYVGRRRALRTLSPFVRSLRVLR